MSTYGLRRRGSWPETAVTARSPFGVKNSYPGADPRAETAVEQGSLAGRVEHVVSGQATAFQSLETLLAFIAQVLCEERERSAEP